MATTKTIDDKNALLIYTVGPVHCCSPALNVESIILPPTLHYTPGSQDFAGVFHYARGMVSVIDLRQRFGVDQEDWKTPGRIVIAEVSGGLTGFWVDEVGDVCSWPQQGWDKTPPFVPRNIFKRTLLHKTHIHLYADFEDLFNCHESGYLRKHIQSLKQHVIEDSNQTPRASKTSVDIPADQFRPTQLETFLSQPAILTPEPTTPLPSHVTHNHPASNHPATKNATRISHRNTNTTTIKITSQSNKNTRILNTISAKATSTRSGSTRLYEEQKPFSAPITASQNNTDEHAPDFHVATDSTRKGRDLSLWYFIGVLITALTILMVVTFQTDPHAPSRPQTNINEDLAPATNHTETSSIFNPKPDSVAAISAQEDIYQARIEHNDGGITITLDEPENSQSVSSKDIIHSTTSLDSSAQTEQSPDSIQKTAEPAETQIIHIVVKGDTLWDIAKHYIHNPWRYPELAKLSKITNPHRIYPGDKVKIIIRKKTNGLNQTVPTK